MVRRTSLLSTLTDPCARLKLMWVHHPITIVSDCFVWTLPDTSRESGMSSSGRNLWSNVVQTARHSQTPPGSVGPVPPDVMIWTLRVMKLVPPQYVITSYRFCLFPLFPFSVPLPHSSLIYDNTPLDLFQLCLVVSRFVMPAL